MILITARAGCQLFSGTANTTMLRDESYPRRKRAKSNDCPRRLRQRDANLRAQSPYQRTGTRKRLHCTCQTLKLLVFSRLARSWDRMVC